LGDGVRAITRLRFPSVPRVRRYGGAASFGFWSFRNLRRRFILLFDPVFARFPQTRLPSFLSPRGFFDIGNDDVVRGINRASKSAQFLKAPFG
jgi:hypothetical protein